MNHFNIQKNIITKNKSSNSFFLMVRNILSLLFILLFTDATEAQLMKRLGDRVVNKMERKAGDKIEKGIDDATDGKKKNKKTTPQQEDKEDSNSQSEENSEDSQDNTSTTPSKSTSTSSGKPSATAEFKTYSKYDFIPGEKILVYEDFQQDAIGDFPAKWNTNATGEIITIEGKEGKWFQVKKDGAYLPEFINDLPENFTLEFDLGTNPEFNYYNSYLQLSFMDLDNKDTEFSKYGTRYGHNKNHSVRLGVHPKNAGGKKGRSEIKTANESGTLIQNDVDITDFNVPNKNFCRVAIWRQNQRMRVYVNQEKIWDLPRGFVASNAGKYNSLIFAIGDLSKEDFYAFTNIRLAVGAPDTRNKLITEGKFVTRGILFDVNSSSIKPESYGTIKDIAAVLKENATVRVRVIGHTDSDGDEKANLELSKKRAESVKSTLISEFAIEGSRIETDGKGESEPIDKSDTPVSKANNRRVEFIKL